MSRGWTRKSAAALHLALSGAIAACLLACVLVWYPEGLLGLVKPNELGLAVAIVLAGPLLTFILFRPGKWGLRFDMAMIGLLHASALAFASWLVFDTRPVYVAFVKDRFELVRAGDIDDGERRKARPPFDSVALGRPRFVAARLPDDLEERTRILFASLAGADIQTFPQYYVDYESLRSEVIGHAKPWSALQPLNPGAEARIERIRDDSGLPPSRLGFLPLRAGKRDLTVIVDLASARPVTIADLKPWSY